MDEKRKEFEDLTKPLIQWLCENYHPHVTIIISPTHAELLEGIRAFQTFQYVKD